MSTLLQVDPQQRLSHRLQGHQNPESVLQPANYPFMLDHLIYNDTRLSRHPTARGQLVAQLGQSLAKHDLFSLDCGEFSDIMQIISEVAAACCQTYNVQRSALVTDGGDFIAIIPFTWT